MRCEEWDLWCYQNYTFPDHGRAFLLRIWNGATYVTAISKWFPDMAVVNNSTVWLEWDFKLTPTVSRYLTLGCRWGKTMFGKKVKSNQTFLYRSFHRNILGSILGLL